MLDLRSLRNLVVLARHLNYVRAAEELGIAQPTLSRSIQALERQLGLRLFDRDRSRVSLTPQGRAISERAGFLLADAAELEQDSRLNATGQGGRLRFGMTPMPAGVLLPALLAERLREAPLVTSEVVVRDVEALWTMLTGGEIEFFVGSEAPPCDLSPLRTEMLARFPLSLIVRAGHPLLSPDGGDGQFPLVRSSWAGLSVPDEIQHQVLGPANIIEDFAALASATATTNALWLSTAWAVPTEIREGRLVEFVRAKERIEVVIYSLARRSQTPLARIVCTSLHHQVRALVESGNEQGRLPSVR